jgi:dephospho-CoA kinase
MEQKGISEEQAMLKINSQVPQNVKVQKADVVIENGGTLKDLTKQVSLKAIP